MSSFFTYLKENLVDKKNIDKTNKALFQQLLDLLKLRSKDNIKDMDPYIYIDDYAKYENDILIIANGLFSDTNNYEIEDAKKKFYLRLIGGKNITIKNISNKFKNNLNEKIISLRNNIIKILK